jgi:hypothetical protein
MNQEEVQIKMMSIATADGIKEIPDPFVAPKVAHDVGSYTPLHWATFKQHHHLVWLLLKSGMNPLDIDMHGNTAIHHAAASGNKLIMECYLS